MFIPEKLSTMAFSWMLTTFSSVNVFLSLFLTGAALLWWYVPSYFRRIWDRRTGRVPPGPWAFPIVGTIDVDRARPDLSFRQWATRYGSVFSFYLGSRFCIGLGDMKLMRKLLKDDRFSGRANAGIFAHLEQDLTKGLRIRICLDILFSVLFLFLQLILEKKCLFIVVVLVCFKFSFFLRYCVFQWGSVEGAPDVFIVGVARVWWVGGSTVDIFSHAKMKSSNHLHTQKVYRIC